MNNLVASLLLNDIVETKLNDILVQQYCSRLITILFKYCSGNNMWEFYIVHADQVNVVHAGQHNVDQAC